MGQPLSDQIWRQVGFPTDRGGLGLETEKIVIGRDFYSRADISYVVAVRSIRYLREALLPHAGDKSILGLAMALQRLETLFPKWGPCARDDGGKFKQKDLLKEVVVAAHGDFLLQLTERDRKRVELYSGAWADGWIRAIPNQAFDMY